MTIIRLFICIAKTTLIMKLLFVKSAPVVFKNFIFVMHFIKVVLQNNESMKSPASMQAYKAPAGRKNISKISLIIENITMQYAQSASVNNI